MKILHCADLHLDSKMTANLPTEKAKERRQEMLASFRRMVQFADLNQVEAVIIAGDLFDKKSCSATARNTILSMIREYPRILFFYLKGNHDRGMDLKGLESDVQNLHLFSEEQWRSFYLGDICITGIELTEKNNMSAFEELKLDPDKYNILVLHGKTEDCSVRPLRSVKGTDSVIPLKTLRNKAIDYLALGHIHKREAGRLDGRGIWCYPGCMEGRGFDECGEHGCVMLEIDPETHRTEITYVPLAQRIFHEIPVDISSCGNSYEILQAIERTLDEGTCSSRDLIKILLTGEAEITSDILAEYLSKQLENRFYYVRVENKTRIKVDYRSFAADPSLKGEFVRRVRHEDSLSEEEKAEIIQFGIRLLMGVDEFED
ncbi:MAG: metallophosphoesterase [Lachnospiraceae bacterium]|nr:metallophosphoesterase [Lachnospiraceae bacterium]